MQLKGHSYYLVQDLIIRDIVFLQDTNLIIFGGSDKNIYFFDYAKEQLVEKIKIHSDIIYKIVIVQYQDGILQMITLSKEMLKWKIKIENDQIIDYKILNKVMVYSQFPVDLVVQKNIIFMSNYYQINDEQQFYIRIINLKDFKTFQKIQLEYKAVKIFYSQYLDKLLIGDSQANLLIYDYQQKKVICKIKNICQNYPFNFKECETQNLLYNQKVKLRQKLYKIPQTVKILAISSFNCHIYLIDQLQEMIEKCREQKEKSSENWLNDIRLVQQEKEENIMNLIGQQRGLIATEHMILMGGSDLNLKVYRNVDIDFMKLTRLSSAQVNHVLATLTYNDQRLQLNYQPSQFLQAPHQDIINAIDSYVSKRLVASAGFDGLVNIYTY